MKKWKRGLKRIAAFTLAVILVGTTVDLSTFDVSAAEGTQTPNYNPVSGNDVCESGTEKNSAVEQQENETAECTCDTDDDSIHATNCAVYVAPENPACTCVEKCTEANVWCDVCGLDYTACTGTDEATVYEDTITSGYCGKDGDTNLTWNFDQTTGTLTISGSGAMANYTFLSGKMNLSKTSDTSACYGCKNLKTVKIGKNVTTIGDKAFYKCTSLTSITIPSKVKKIGKSAFEGCKKLKTVTIKTKLLKSSKVGKKAFKSIKSNATIKVPKKKFKAYKSMLLKKGVSKKAKFKKI